MPPQPIVENILSSLWISKTPYGLFGLELVPPGDY